MTKMIHSYWAYIVLITLIFAVVNAIMGLSSKKEFSAKDLRISLFALITSHIQLIIGFIAYYTSDYYVTMKSIGMGEVMKSSELRKILVEHPLVGIIAIALLFRIIKNKFKIFPYSDGKISLKSRGFHLFMPIFVSYLGYLIVAGIGSMFHAEIYVLPYLAIYLIHTI